MPVGSPLAVGPASTPDQCHRPDPTYPGCSTANGVYPIPQQRADDLIEHRIGLLTHLLAEIRLALLLGAAHLVELVEELLDEVRWLRVLGYANQFLIERQLKVSQDERDKVLAAAVRAVDSDKSTHDWHERLGRLKGEALHIRRSIRRAQKDIAQGKPEPESPGARSADGLEP